MGITNNHIIAYKRLANAFFNDKCTACGSKKILQIHHKDGNSSHNSLENLTLLCSKCHGEEHAKLRRVNKKTNKKATCKRCKYSWTYNGQGESTSCPSCGNKVKIREMPNEKPL